MGNTYVLLIPATRQAIHRDEVSHRFGAVSFIRDVDGVSNLRRLRSRLDLKLKHDDESATCQGPDARENCFRRSDTLYVANPLP